MRVRRSAASALAALLIAASALTPARADAAAQALSPWDAQLYAAAFDSMRKGDFAVAESKLSQVTDKCLVGLVEFQKLFHPTAYKATYAELNDWLAKYGDLPVASRVRALAKKRKLEGAADTTPLPMQAPSTAAPTIELNFRTWDDVAAAQDSAELPDDPAELLGPKAAREALNAGDLDGAIRLADQIGDPWVAGLAWWRKKNYAEAYRKFEQVALDVTGDGWVRSGAAYWAARAAVAKGSPQDAPQLLRVAAQFPRTFYGQIAERQLGLAPALRTGPVPYAARGTAQVFKAGGGGPELDTPAMRRFVQSNLRARRALALAQLGQRIDAGVELRAGLKEASDDQERADWTALALGINAMFASGADQQAVDPNDYPLPDLQPAGGFTVDKALVYALIRQETSFNSNAVSYAGAYGLMQLMPATAALIEGDDKLRKEPQRLLEPSTNLRVGQDYIHYLMSLGPISGDLLKMVAAYNGGPAPVFSTVKQLGPDADPLLVIESVPVPQARDYVERVMANYWVYRRLLGQDSPSLDAVAQGAKKIDAALDPRTAAPAFTASLATAPATP
jgi:soluble lytic murein transglycosylase-like protein